MPGYAIPTEPAKDCTSGRLALHESREEQLIKLEKCMGIECVDAAKNRPYNIMTNRMMK
jgi:hypothetical protein